MKRREMEELTMLQLALSRLARKILEGNNRGAALAIVAALQALDRARVELAVKTQEEIQYDTK